MVSLAFHDLYIDKPNPRFAGLDYNSMDPEPYGNAIDEMYNSMVEHFKKHNSLLMQPIVVVDNDGKYSVRAGYTRAITFLTRYQMLCDELQVTSLEIPAIVYDYVDVIDSLMENIVRNEQHYMTIAHAIDSIAEFQSIKNIAHQLGMTTNNAIKLKSLTTLSAKIKKLCYDNIIDVKVAYELVQLDIELQEQIAEYIVDNDISYIGEGGLSRIYNYLVPSIIPGMFTGSFVDNDGKEWPAIENDENYYLFNMEWKVVDEEQMILRQTCYNDTIIKKYNLDVINRDDINVYSGYRKVEFGSYPNEIAVWSFEGHVIEFYVKESDMKKVENIKEYIEEKKNDVDTRSDRKLFTLKNAKIMEYVKREIIDAFTSGDFNNDTVYYNLINNMMMGMNSRNKQLFTEITGQEYNLDNVMANDPVNTMTLARILSDGYVSNTIKNIMTEYDIDYDWILNKVNAEIEDEKEEITSKTHNKKEEMNDAVDDIASGIAKIRTTFMMCDEDSLYRNLMDKDLDETILKFIARTTKQQFKGNAALTQIRLKNTLAKINKTLISEREDAIINDTEEEYVFINKIIEENYNHLVRFGSSQNVDIINAYDNVIEALVLNGKIEGAGKYKFKADSVLTAMAENRKFRTEFYTAVWQNIVGDLKSNFNVCYLNKSGKLTIFKA